MAPPRDTRWEIQPHTKVKHLILRKYLDAWLPVMASWNGRVVFIDGFAGPGRYVGGEEGSPLIALRALLEHPYFQATKPRCEFVFMFIESDRRRADALKAELKDLDTSRKLPSWIHVNCHEGEFAVVIGAILAELKAKGKQLAPTFAFIDPFGFAGIPLDVVAQLVKSQHCECLVNFSYEPINRFLSNLNAKNQAHLEALFGTPDWRDVADVADPNDRRDKLVGLYRQQLRQVAGLEYVRTFEMVNEGNRTEYLLYFGTHSPKGLSVMKQAMWKADPETGQIFSDRSDPSQFVLLRPGGEEGLRPDLRRHFKGRRDVSIAEVERYVLEETPYSEKMHLRQRTLAVMERATPPEIEVHRPAGKRKKPGEYPPGTRFSFLSGRDS